MLRGYCTEANTEELLAGEPSLDFLYHRSDLRADIKEVLADIEAGDTLVVLSARPLVRSTLELVKLLASIVEVGADFRSLNEPWLSTEGTAGTFVRELADLERSIHLERTAAGREKAAAAGITGGRPPKLSFTQRAAALDMYREGFSQIEIGKAFHVSPTFVSHLVRDGLFEDAV
jgi:DNA invertase Pin-like site-specific DNA recombinase